MSDALTLDDRIKELDDLAAAVQAYREDGNAGVAKTLEYIRDRRWFLIQNDVDAALYSVEHDTEAAKYRRLVRDMFGSS